MIKSEQFPPWCQTILGLKSIQLSQTRKKIDSLSKPLQAPLTLTRVRPKHLRIQGEQIKPSSLSQILIGWMSERDFTKLRTIMNSLDLTM